MICCRLCCCADCFAELIIIYVEYCTKGLYLAKDMVKKKVSWSIASMTEDGRRKREVESGGVEEGFWRVREMTFVTTSCTCC